MAFVNRELQEEEQREYKLKEKVRGFKDYNYIAKFDGGTIDDENDIRMFIYGEPRRLEGRSIREIDAWEDPTDYFTRFGILDFKGEVLYFTAIIEVVDYDVKWIVKEFTSQDYRKKAL